MGPGANIPVTRGYGHCVEGGSFGTPDWSLQCPSPPSQAGDVCATVAPQGKAVFFTNEAEPQHPRIVCAVCAASASIDDDDAFGAYSGAVSFGANSLNGVSNETSIEGYEIHAVDTVSGNLLAKVAEGNTSAASLGNGCCDEGRYQVNVTLNVYEVFGFNRTLALTILPRMLGGAVLPYGKIVTIADVSSVPFFEPDDLSQSKYEEVKTATTAEIVSQSSSPTAAPTSQPTSSGNVLVAKELEQTHIETKINVAYTQEELQNSAVQKALRCGVSVSLKFPAEDDCESVQLANITTSRRLQGSTLTPVDFIIISVSTNASEIEYLTANVQKSSSSGALIANIQVEAKKRDVLTRALQSQPREQTVVVNARKVIVQILVEETMPPAPPPGDEAGDNAASVAIAVVVVVGIILATLAVLAFISIRRRRKANNPNAEVEAPSDALKEDAAEAAAPEANPVAEDSQEVVPEDVFLDDDSGSETSI
eukprot:TRINITY_DN1412_c1_g1_i5.p1 TRINITY_DN1412_c1_g1~~TRINITY_DN1412_c1_g1_i5.p1  ORF type:complete len:480 (+),score=95.65 TRINITY_DN1412_c1_g1_i5:952-2391(+)